MIFEGGWVVKKVAKRGTEKSKKPLKTVKKRSGDGTGSTGVRIKK